MRMFSNVEDSYLVEEFSDNEEDVASSDEEDDFFLAALVGNKSGFKRKQRSDVDDFEREMNAELNSAVVKMTMNSKSGSHSSVENASKTSDVVPQASNSVDSNQQQFYEDIYFDSDEDADEIPQNTNARKQKKKHPVISNDDLFYDPNLDQEDQDWVDKRRQSHRPKSQGRAQSKKIPQSDAVLNCPACMTTLCDDCQRHDVYKSQFRAMFVTNCTVEFDKVLQHKPSNRQPRQKKIVKSEMPQLEGPSIAECYHPVRCSVCKTEVAVYDKEEVYHFFNVLTSHG